MLVYWLIKLYTELFPCSSLFVLRDAANLAKSSFMRFIWKNLFYSNHEMQPINSDVTY
jgi:hypothetical protein